MVWAIPRTAPFKPSLAVQVVWVHLGNRLMGIGCRQVDAAEEEPPGKAHQTGPIAAVLERLNSHKHDHTSPSGARHPKIRCFLTCRF